MNKINKNLPAIEQKFLSLKVTHQLYDSPTPIAEVVDVITSGIIQESEVQDYLKYVHSSRQIEFINEKWYDLNISEMILLFSRVIKHRNANSSKQSLAEEKANSSPKKKKLKKSFSQAHQNPYIPEKIKRATKNPIGSETNVIQKENNQNQNITPQQNKNPQIPEIQQISKQEDQKSLVQLKLNSTKSSAQNSPSGQSKTKQIALGLPVDFENLPAKEKYSILTKKYGKDKSILQKKFDSIYKHYRKEMYIPFQCFQLNNELLMDMRIFLKYYRQFEISKNYKTNEAMQHFKKVALNGLWLDDKRFIELHYKLMELLDVDQKDFKQQLQNDDLTNSQRMNQLKKELFKHIEILMQNIGKIKQVSGLVSDQKIKQVFYNTKHNKNFVKKIVEVHSGLIKDDVLLKLQERVEERKLKKNSMLGKINMDKSGLMSPDNLNMSSNKILEDPTLRLSPHQLSIYDELSIPKLRSREMKKSSIYSSLQILNMHKQKEKLKQLINEKDNQKYLQAYFKKQKKMYTLPRSSSVFVSRSPTQNEESTNNFSIKSAKSINNFNRDTSNIFQRNFSLPRMKFT